MKLRLILIAAMILGFGVVQAQTPAPTPPAKAAPSKTAPGKAKPAPKKEEPLKIEGTVLSRPDGTFLGLTLSEGKFKLAFYDKERKPMPVNVLRATARWPNLHGPGQNRAVLTPGGDGSFLIAPQFVRGPHAFKLFLTLIKSEDPGAPTETYTVDFRG